jgi:hypothetical protein
MVLGGVGSRDLRDQKVPRGVVGGYPLLINFKIIYISIDIKRVDVQIEEQRNIMKGV